MLVVNPNLCFGRVLSVDTFAAGTVSRPSRVVVGAGGKGVNVLRTAADLGHPATIAVPVTGAVRMAIIVLESSGRATVLNEPGRPDLDPGALDRPIATLADALTDHPVPVVCSGSLPPGLPTPDPPTAIFAANPRAAIGVAHRLHTTDRQDDGFMSFGDCTLAETLQPAVTVVNQDRVAIGYAAIDRALAHRAERIRRREHPDNRAVEDPPRTVLVGTELVGRGSGEVRP